MIKNWKDEKLEDIRYFNTMNSWLAYFLPYSRKCLSYRHDVLPENAIRSPASEAQGKMAALGDKNTLTVGFLFYRIFRKRLAQSVRSVGESNIDAQTLLYVAICNKFVR